VLIALGFLWLTRIGARSSYMGHVFGPGCLVSFAVGVLFVPLAAAGTADVHYSEAGLASGVLNTARQVGGSIGLAVLATVAIDRTHSVLRSGHASTSAAAALASGYARAFLLAAVLGAVGFVAAFIVPSIKPKPAPQTEASEALAPLPHPDSGMMPELA
jgi:hypothetical protein